MPRHVSGRDATSALPNGHYAMRGSLAALISILLLSSWLHAAGTNYYVDNSAACPGNGTEQSPWCSLSSANAHDPFHPGDKILLKRGNIYRMGNPINIPLSPRGSGISTLPSGLITIGTYGKGPRPILDGELLGGEEANGGPTVTVSGNTITDTSKKWEPNQWVGAFVWAGSNGARVLSNTATTLVTAGNFTNPPPNGWFYILNLAASAIKLTDQSYWAIRDLEIRNTFYGINITSTSGNHKGFRISGIYSHDNAEGIYLRPGEHLVPAGNGVSFSDVRIDDVESAHDNVGIQVNNSSEVLINRLFAHDVDGRSYDGRALPCGWGQVGISQNVTPSASGLTLINTRVVRGGACVASPTGAINSGMKNVTFVNSLFTNTPSQNQFDQSGVDFEANAQNGSNEGNRLQNSYIADNAGPGVEIMNLPFGHCFEPQLNLTGLEISGNLFANNGWSGPGTDVSHFDNWGGAIFAERILPCEKTPTTNSIGIADNLVVAQNGCSLRVPLTAGTVYTTLLVSTTAAWLPPAGKTITLTDPTGVHSQNVVLAAGSTPTALHVVAFTASHLYPTGSGVGLTSSTKLQSPPNFIVQGQLHPFSTADWTMKNNLDLGSGTGLTANSGAANNLAYSGYEFSGFQYGAGSTSATRWSYQQSADGVNWSNLGYFNHESLTNPVWQPSPTVSSPHVGVFEQYPPSTTNAWVARSWTAPATGAVAIRGRILRTDSACNGGAVARITRNGKVIWGPQTINAKNDPANDGIVTNLDHQAVAVGDVLRFETTMEGGGQCAVSWAPGLGFTNLVNNGGFETAGTDCLSGWSRKSGISGCANADTAQGSLAAFAQADGKVAGENTQEIAGWLPGQHLTLAAFGRVVATGQIGQVVLRAQPSNADLCKLTFTNSVWTYLSTSGCTIPAGTKTVSVAFFTTTTLRNHKVLADGISATVHNPNLVFNPGFEQNLVGWTSVSGKSGLTPITGTAPDVTQAAYAEADGILPGEIYQRLSGWSAGDKLTLSAYGAVENEKQTGKISLWSSGPNVDFCTLTYANAGSYAYQFKSGCEVPSGTNELAVVFRTASRTKGDRVYADRISVTRTQ